MERRNFLKNLGLTSAAGVGIVLGVASSAEAKPSPVGNNIHLGCRAMKVNSNEWRAICPCGKKGPWEGRLDDAQGDARRHRKSGSGF